MIRPAQVISGGVVPPWTLLSSFAGTKTPAYMDDDGKQQID